MGNNTGLVSLNKVIAARLAVCDFTSILSVCVFWSYQDDGRRMMKGCGQWNLISSGSSAWYN